MLPEPCVEVLTHTVNWYSYSSPRQAGASHVGAEMELDAEGLQAMVDKRLAQSGRKPQWHKHLQSQLKGYVDALTKPNFAD